MSWWVRLLLIAGLVAGIVAGAAAIRSHYVSQGDAQGASRVQAAWDAQKRVDDAESLRIQKQANADLLQKFRNTERISDEEATRTHRRLDRERNAAAVVDGLRSTIDRLNRRDLSAAASDPRLAGIAHEATIARELFGNCSAAHKDLGAEADRLRDQVAGLHDFIATVCQPAAPEKK
jgi:hypothetical protein